MLFHQKSLLAMSCIHDYFAESYGFPEVSDFPTIASKSWNIIHMPGVVVEILDTKHGIFFSTPYPRSLAFVSRKSIIDNFMWFCSGKSISIIFIPSTSVSIFSHRWL